MRIQTWLPVIVSIATIIFVAILEKQSKLIAAITTTMPLNVSLALWIVYSSAGGERSAITQFSRGLFLGVLPTLGFLLVVWIAARVGLKFMPMILWGYVIWGFGLIILLLFKETLGFK